MSDQRDDDTILHQAEVEEVIENVIEESVGATGDAITDASVAHSINSTFSDTEVEAALNALGGKINSILAVLRTNGIIES